MVIFVFNIMQPDKCATSEIVKLRPFIPSEEKCKSAASRFLMLQMQEV